MKAKGISRLLVLLVVFSLLAGLFSPAVAFAAGERYLVTNQGTITNGTGVITESPADLVIGANVVHVTTSGTFTIFLASGTTGTATGSGGSGDCKLKETPVSLIAGSNAIETESPTGHLTITLVAHNAVNWNTVNSWSATSGGLAGAGIPTATNSVYMDSLSFPNASTVLTINALASCLNLDWTGTTNTPSLTGSYNLSISGNATFIPAMSISLTSVINCSGNFAGGGHNFNILHLMADSTITDNNSFATLNLNPSVAQVITFADGSTQTVGNASLSGSSGKIHTLRGSSTGGWTINKSGGGTVSNRYLNLSYSAGTPANTWYYDGATSSIGTGVTGWNEYSPVAISVSPTSKNFGKMYENISYWSNGSAPTFPLDDSECYFTITNEGSVVINISINASNFTGGLGWALTSGTPGSGEARMKAGMSGNANEAVMVTLNSSPQAFISSLASLATKKWELKLETGVFTDGISKENHIILVAVEDI
jgi:hypothetical protein